jgi:hypothetical protein
VSQQQAELDGGLLYGGNARWVVGGGEREKLGAPVSRCRAFSWGPLTTPLGCRESGARRWVRKEEKGGWKSEGGFFSLGEVEKKKRQ